MAKQRITAVPCVVRTGTLNELTGWHNHDSEQRARSAMVKYFKGWDAFARTRTGAGGKDPVPLACSEVAGLVIGKAPRAVHCLIDPHTNMTLVAEVQHGTWDPKLGRVV